MYTKIFCNIHGMKYTFVLDKRPNILVLLLPKAEKAPKDITVYWDQLALTWILF